MALLLHLLLVVVAGVDFTDPDKHFLHGGDGSAVAGYAQRSPVLFQLFEYLLEEMRLVAGQQISQFGADVLVDGHFRNRLADQFRDPLDVTAAFLHNHQMVAGPVFLLQEQRRACGVPVNFLLSIPVEQNFIFFKITATLDLPAGHDGDAIAQQIGLLHEMSRQQNGPADFFRLKEIPSGSTGGWIHTGSRLVQHDDLLIDCERISRISSGS